MVKTLNKECEVIKSFNNNIALVKHEGREKILFSKGIGFNKKYGDLIPAGIEVNKSFVIENDENIQNFNTLTKRVDEKFIDVCEGIIYNICNGLEEEISENIHIGLIDHLWFSVKRLEKGEEIQNPFAYEIETLYPLEFKLASQAALILEDKFNINIPYGEVGFITLHIHSARNNGKLSNTIKYNYIINKIILYVENNLNLEIDKASLDYARFLTHLKFAIERISRNSTIKNDLVNVIRRKYKKSYKIAIGIASILEIELDCELPKDEIAYIAMHVERIINR